MAKDIQYLITSTTSILHEYELKLDDFQTSKLEELNNKIGSFQEKFLGQGQK